MHGGTYCARFDVSASNGNARISQTLALTANKRYRYSFWYKGTDATVTVCPLIQGVTAGFLQGNNSWSSATPSTTITCAGTWLQGFVEFVPPVTENYSIILNKILATSKSVWFDDISVKEITYISVQPNTVAFWEANSRTSIFNTLRTKSGMTTPTQLGQTGGFLPIQTHTYSGAPKSTSPIGWRLDGVNDYITNLGPSPTAALSYSIWAKREAGGGTYEVALHIGDFTANYPALCLRASTDAPTASLGLNNSRIWSATTPRTTTDGKWHHYVFVIPSALQAALSSAVLYVDGQLQTAGTTDVTGAQAARTTISIGRAGTSYPKGHLALPLLFDRIVSLAEAVNIFAATKGMFYPR
jgi:hypothetical protein